MKVYRHIDEFKGVERPVLTTGTFDGVHVGHRTIINRLREVAQQVNGESVLLTFFPHPRMVLFQDSDLRLITTLEEKVALLEEAGIDHLIIHPFDKAFSRLSSLEFVRDVLANQLGVHTLVIGYDHHFGRNREGSFEHLMEYSSLYGFEVEEIPAQEVNEVNVSSTKIRKALLAGEMDEANEFLTRPFQLNGQVVEGDQIGRTLGFPTANIQVNEPYKLIPAQGVYAVRVEFEGRSLPGMLNVGVRPTLGSEGDLRLEVHLINFSGDLYGKKLKLHLLSYLRKDVKFDNLEQLKQQLREDEKATKLFFKVKN